MRQISSSDELNQYIATDILELAGADYHLTLPEYKTVNLFAHSPAAVRIHVDAPLCLGIYSRLADVTIIPTGDLAAIQLDHSSYTVLDRVVLQSSEPWAKYGIKRGDPFPRRGIGIQTTRKNDGDNSYHVRLNDVQFVSFVKGIECQTPGRKGTVAWILDNPVFNGCEIGLDLIRAGEWRVTGGIVQLARVGVNLDGHTNWFDKVHFERNEMDIQVGPNSAHNVFYTDALKNRVDDAGVDTQFTYLTHRNIPRDAPLRP